VSRWGREDIVALVALAVTVSVWSWPLVTFAGPLPARNFDAFCVEWVAAAATRLGADLVDPLSQWPLGNSLARADSFVYLALAKVFTPLLGVDGMVNGLAWIGPVVSGWAAERTARRAFGVPSPWSIVAGLVYACNGLTTTMLLEGHVYLLLVPWLPLLVGALEGLTLASRPRDGALAAVWWSLALATSAYVGVAASLIVALYLVRGALRRPFVAPGPGFAPFLAGCLVFGGLYTWSFVSAPGSFDVATIGNNDADAQMVYGSARLGLLLGWSPAVDLEGHSAWPSISAGALALTLFAGRRSGTPTRLLVLGGLALVLSLGPQLDAFAPGDLAIPWILAPAAVTPLGAFFRFPSRLLLVVSLSFGIVAAGMLARIARTRPREAALFACALGVEAIVGAGLPWRTRSFEGSMPEAYAAAPEGWAVLELLPTFGGPGEVNLALYFDRLTCRWQALHGRPTLAQCVDTRPYAGVAHAVGVEVLGKLVTGDTAQLADDLRAIGIGAVTLRPDLLAAQDRADARAALTAARGGAATTSHNGGDYVELWRVPGTSASLPDPDARIAALHTLLGSATP